MSNILVQLGLIVIGLFIGWSISLGVAVSIISYYQNRNRPVPSVLKRLVPGLGQ
jgi:hypothetical protein